MLSGVDFKMPKKTPNNYPVLDDKPIDQWRVTELREELRRRRLATKGLKEELVRRLDEAIRNEIESQNDGELGNGIDGNSDVQDNNEENEPDPAPNDGEMGSGIDGNSDFRDNTEENQAAQNDGDGNEMEAQNDGELGDGINDNLDIKDNTEDHEANIAQNDGEIGDGIDGNSDAPNNNEENEAVTTREGDTHMMVDENKKGDADADMVDINVGISDINQGSEDQKGEETEGAGLARLVDKEGTTETMEDNESCNQNVVSQSGTPFEAVPTETHDDPTPLIEESAVIQLERNNQVSEVNQGLEFQVNYVSNNDSVSLNDRNNIKDNLTADNLPLELEVVKQEVVSPASNSYPPTGDVACIVRDDQLEGLKHLSNEQGLCEDHVLYEQDMGKNPISDEKEGANVFISDEQDDDKKHVLVGQETIKVDVPLGDASLKNDSNVDLPKKEDSADGGSPEKVNLDRSSGDESMDEDISEHKLVETEIKSEEPTDKFEVKHELDDRASEVTLSKFSLSKKASALDDAKPVFAIEKRKMEESEAVTENDAPKRQRRWNPDTIKVPEQQTPQITISSAYKSNEQPPLRPTFSRSNSILSGDSPKERIVPLPKKLATSSLRIDNFLRPFTLKAVQDLLAKTGKVCDFWMDHIKTHCYVTFSSVEEATVTRNAVYNLQWPPNGGRLLVAEFVDPQEVKTRLEAPPQSPAPVSPNPTTVNAAPSPRTQDSLPVRQQALIKQQLQLPPPPPLTQPPPPPLSTTPIPTERAQRQPASPPKKPEAPVVTLDDLFKKTKASPRIYYLPLSEEQVTAKLAAQGKSSTQVP
ncbi:hypothetical protein AXF42_Ash004088 [Apostasia shenzhenica]|uniref:SAP domain-containing protein n=1 Tax=Apostasia shenzhenica TaxID=1088818 RepID=A0A2I0A1Y2_9ASPA|nr:hypothetical protein AXF42_Ash004088 [Apostasia shenzhenica]